MGRTTLMITSTMRLAFSSMTPRMTCMPYTMICMNMNKLKTNPMIERPVALPSLVMMSSPTKLTFVFSRLYTS